MIARYSDYVSARLSTVSSRLYRLRRDRVTKHKFVYTWLAMWTYSSSVQAVDMSVCKQQLNST